MAVDGADYNFAEIESYWQAFWADHKTFCVSEDSSKPQYYILDMFPYPSGSGLHVGHPEGYTASDIIARYRMARGFNVLHPMGWDAFGLPAEQYALQTGVHPAETTRENIATFRRQIQSLGFALDWSREINTTDPKYYRWTQWIFLQLFKHGLAYVDERPVWWCPALGTVLANEEVIDGLSERGNHPVERRRLSQWVLRITSYADKLLDGLKGLDWPDSTKRQQTAWIGRSEGAEVDFTIEGLSEDASEKVLTVFTTRPDTLFGATYVVVAPEHPLLAKIVVPEQRVQVEGYQRQSAGKSDLDRTDLAKEKTGVFTGAYALNPINQRRIPIWVADYVLMSYGTGAIMAVPAHDERDYAFARAFDLPMRQVIAPQSGGRFHLPFTDDGVLIDSGPYTGLDAAAAKEAITAELECIGSGRGAVHYKLRDWLFSRQRYWGEPFPIVWVDESAYRKVFSIPDSAVRPFLPEQPVTRREGANGALFALPLPPSELPVKLPVIESYQPAGDGRSPLANVTGWTDVLLDLNTGATLSAQSASRMPSQGYWVRGYRETDTMPQWAGSCWYHLRYLDTQNPEALVGEAAERYWGTPSIYIGGAEHAVLHLLYARFWHRFLHDIGVVSTPEPYRRLFHQGIILGEDGEKMSKSRGNVINPESVVGDYGADTLRLYEMFLGPLEAAKPWSPKGIEGVHRFLRKVWREIIASDATGSLNPKLIDAPEDTPETVRLLHATIKKVTEDIEALRFNTAISQMMILVNHLTKVPRFSRATACALVQLLAPFAPHISEELWERLGGEPSVAVAPWPSYDPLKLVESKVTIVFQVNGKVRGDARLPMGVSEAEVVRHAKSDAKVCAHLRGKSLLKAVYVPGRVLNFVVK